MLLMDKVTKRNTFEFVGDRYILNQIRGGDNASFRMAVKAALKSALEKQGMRLGLVNHYWCFFDIEEVRSVAFSSTLCSDIFEPDVAPLKFIIFYYGSDSKYDCDAYAYCPMRHTIVQIDFACNHRELEGNAEQKLDNVNWQISVQEFYERWIKEASRISEMEHAYGRVFGWLADRMMRVYKKHDRSVVTKFVTQFISDTFEADILCNEVDILNANYNILQRCMESYDRHLFLKGQRSAGATEGSI